MSVHPRKLFSKTVGKLDIDFLPKNYLQKYPSFDLPSKSHFSSHPLLYLSYSTPGEDSPKKIPSARISCPKGSQAYGSYCYALFQIPQTWFDAEVSAGKRKIHVDHGAMLGFILPSSFCLR